MADVAKRLVGPLALTASSTVLYTVPVSTTTIVRSIHVMNSNLSNVIPFSLGINGTAATLGFSFFSAFQIAPNGVLDWSGFVVLAAGETLTGFCGTASTLALTICGVEVS